MLSIFGVEDKQKVLQKITSEKSEIRFELGKRIKNQLRKVPELAFFLDDSLDYIERIDQLLDE
jgi:ribosome-binding factor A